MTFAEMAEKRYSVKKFDSRSIEQEKLDAVLKTACIAPTAKNAQSARIYVLSSPDALKKAQSLTPCTYGAPVVLLFAYNKKEAFVYPGDTGAESGEEDCSILAVHVMFEALEQGLGTCWVNNFDPSRASSLYNLPDEEKAVLLMPIGYAAEEFSPLPNHTKKKPMGEIVKVL